ncbi:response regulator [bacterium]|nr:response regulator [bacterium]
MYSEPQTHEVHSAIIRNVSAGEFGYQVNDRQPLSTEKTHHPSTATLLIASSQRLFAEAFAAALQGHDQITVVNCCQTQEAALYLCAENSPQLLLMDVAMISTTVTNFLHFVAQLPTAVRVVLLADNDSDVLLEQALQAHVSGYLLKSESLESCLRELLNVASGEQVVSKSLLPLLRKDSRGHWQLAQPSAVMELSDRQIEIVRLIALGHSVKEISQILRMTIKSVDSHKYRIMRQLKIHDRVQLANYASKHGIQLRSGAASVSAGHH